MGISAKKQDIFLAKPQRASLRFPRGWEDVVESELVALSHDSFAAPQLRRDFESEQSSAIRVAKVRTGFELRGISFRGLCELPLRVRTLRELVWLVHPGGATSKEELRETVASSPIAWIVGPNNSTVEVAATSQRSRLFHTGLIEEQIAEELRAQGVRVAEHGDVTIYAELWRDTVTLGVGLGGESLGKRGYKIDLRSLASLKEELAACCIAGFESWATSESEDVTVDAVCVPFAGSGTLAVESILAFAEVAPCIFGRRYGAELLAVSPTKSLAHVRKRLQGGKPVPEILCVEKDRVQCEALRNNLQHAQNAVRASGRKMADAKAVEADWFEYRCGYAAGTRLFLPLNPPFGDRLDGEAHLGQEQSVSKFYRRIGSSVRTLRAEGVRVSGLVLCPDPGSRRAFLDGMSAARHTVRSMSHGGKQMEVLYFLDPLQ